MYFAQFVSRELTFLFSSNGAVGSGGAGGWTAPQANVRSLVSPNAWHHARQADNCFVAKVEYGYLLTIGRSIHINHSDSFNCQGTGHERI